MKQEKAHYCFKQEAGSDVFKLYIYDNVSEYVTFNWFTWEYEESETSAEYFRKALDEIPENATIEIHINSYGGSVKEGVAIYNQLKQKKCKEIVAYVDGFAYSIASVILQAADRRIMGLGTSLLIHNMWISIDGNAAQLRKAADDLDTLMESSRQLYLERINISEAELIEMMDNETYLTPDQAVEMGFADEVSGREAENGAPDVMAQLQQQLQQMRREMAAQKSFREEMRQFCKPSQKDDEDEDTDDKDEDADGDADDEDTDDEDEKKEKANADPKNKSKLARLLASAAVKNFEKTEREVRKNEK